MIKYELSAPRQAALLVGLAGLAVASLAACSSGGSTDSPSAAAECPVTVTDPWVKAVDKGMTAAFGTLSNTGDAAVTITSASSPASSAMELHEVVDNNGEMVMQPVPGGFPVPAGGTLPMEPGGYHLMLMDVTAPIKAGEDVAVTLTCSNGATAGFTAQARTFEGGEEEYRNDGMDSMDSTGEMSMTPTPTPAES